MMKGLGTYLPNQATVMMAFGGQPADIVLRIGMMC